MEDLPRFTLRLPELGQGTARAFEVGNTAFGYAAGTVLVALYVETWASIDPGALCLLVTTRRGIVLKPFEPSDAVTDDVIEIWEPFAHIRAYTSSAISLDEIRAKTKQLLGT